MFAKIEISGYIETVTGLHIGGSSAFSAIGAVDSPVITDIRTGQPMIPGSSLKGKMRTLLAKRYNTVFANTPDDDAECLTELFGSSKKNHVKTSRILFSDMFLKNMEELRHAGLTGATEVKFENSISRTTAVANPRQIERVVRGAVFPMQLLYEVTDELTEEKILQDFQLLKEGFQLLEYDYLGGNGSRGYGRIHIKDLQVDVVVGDVENTILDKCQEILER
ncbi:MAG: type III-A CRISPR-associated RAMP protein Csm3 [Lachnospiraceae bacterium]